MEKSQIERIAVLMESKGVSVKELADSCGVSHMTIRRILNGETQSTNLEIINAIASALGVDERYILDGKDFSPQDYKGVKGYIDYQGHISRIETFKQLEAIYQKIKDELTIPREAKNIMREDRVNKKTQSKTIDINSIDLFRPEHYDTSKVATWDFRKSDDERDEMPNNIGNMCKGYEFDMADFHFLNSEAAYICGLFSNGTQEHDEIQRELIAEPNGYATKKVIRRKYERVGREDWEEFNVQWMLYVVWCKAKSNKAFSDLLRRIPSNCIIIENSTHQRSPKGQKDTSAFWGARNNTLEEKRDLLEKDTEIQNHSTKAKELARLKMQARNSISNFGTWEGVNCMGKILTICKHCIENETEPPVNYDLLRAKKIYLRGKLLSFDDEAVKHRPQHKTIIFDFDGTLLDTRPLMQYEHLFKEPQRGTEEWKQGRKEYLGHVKDCVQWEGMNVVIDYLRQHHISTCIVTANTKDRVVEAIKAFGWADVFDKDSIIGCYALGRKRVSKDNGDTSLFEKALEVLQVEAGDCIAFGNEVSDYIAASSIGIEAYNCYWGANDEDKEVMVRDMRETILESPKDIIDVLKRSLL